MVTVALLIASIIYSLLGILIWARATSRDTIRPLAWMMLALAIWSAGYGEEIAARTLFEKLVWVKVQYPAIVSAPVLWLFFVVEYTGHSAMLTRRNRGLAALIPFIIVVANWTNDFHHNFYIETHLEFIGDLSLFAFTRGWLYLVNVIYSYILLTIGSVLLLTHTIQSISLYRTQAILILLGTASPWIGSILYMLEWFPIAGFDPTPFAFIPTAMIMTWAMLRYRFLDIIPPAQNIILQGLRDGILLLNSRKEVVYINHSAEELLSVSADKALGQPAGDVCRECASSILPRLGMEEQRVEITLDQKGKTRYFDVDIVPHLESRTVRQDPPSYMIVFHDITRQKQAQEELKIHDAIIQAVALASNLFLKSISWEKNIPGVLAQMGEAASVSRVYIFECDTSKDGISHISRRYEWAQAGTKPQIDNPNLQQFEWCSAGYGGWDEALRKRKIISGPMRDFPESERTLLNEQGILSIAVMPVFIEDDFWGGIGFEDCVSERTWSDAELEAMQAAADIFGAALKRGEIEKRLLNRQLTLNLLHRILRAALSSSDFRSMAQGLVDDLIRLLNADNCFFTLWDPIRRRTFPFAASGSDSARRTYGDTKILPGEKTFTESALEVGHTLVVEDVFNSSYISQRLNDTNIASALVVPLIVEGNGLGAILFAFNQPHKFSQEEIDNAEEASSLISLALAKFQAVEEAHRRVEEADTLRRAGAAISETLNLQETTTRLLEQLAFVIPHDSASVQLLRDGELEIIGGEGWDGPASIIGVRFPIPGNNPNTVVIQTRQPYLVNDAHETFPVFRTIAHASHIRSWLGVPLIVHNEIIGLLAIDSREPYRFTTDNIELVSAFAVQVAVAIENARLFEEVQQLAITDGLTGLYNRRHFLDLAENEFERALRYKRDLSIMLFDIDHFKYINDEYGHPIGDEVLRTITSLCIEKLREADPIGRYGGEEFIALIVESPPELALKVGERLRQEVENMTVSTEKGDIQVTISVGIAGVNEHTPNLETLINRADQALYVAKHKGRNRVVIGR